MKWGLIGYGRIAKKFYKDLLLINHQVAAIATRSKSEQLPEGVTSYTDYQDLINDQEVDIVYVANTHNAHAEWTIKALNAGKHVLCEKPLSTSFKTSYDMVEAAKKNNMFLMEAVWSRYLPGYQKAIGLVRDGAIGEVLQVNAHFGFQMDPDAPKERLVNPALAGGAVWDVGIYPISLAQDVFEEDPMTVKADAILTDQSIEERCAIQMTYPNQGIAQVTCSFSLKTMNQATITGTKGHIVMHDFWKCERMDLLVRDEPPQSFHEPMNGGGLCHEAKACINLIESGLIESPLMTWEHSLQLARIMDNVLSQVR